MSKHRIIRVLSSNGRKRAAAYLREYGIRCLWLKALERTVNYYQGILMVRRLEPSLHAVTVDLPVRVDLLKEDELDDYVRFHTNPTPSTILNRLRNGHWCFVARYKGEIVHTAWVVQNNKMARASCEFVHLKVVERLAPDEVYCYDVFTIPAFRGRNIPAARNARMTEYFREAGFRRVVATGGPENRASLRMMEKAGYKPLGVMHFLSIGPLKISFYFNGRYEPPTPVVKRPP